MLTLLGMVVVGGARAVLAFGEDVGCGMWAVQISLFAVILYGCSLNCYTFFSKTLTPCKHF